MQLVANGYQGESLASAFERMTQASYVNVARDTGSARSLQLMTQAAAFGRLGMHGLNTCCLQN
jgi:hypothetical protein